VKCAQRTPDGICDKPAPLSFVWPGQGSRQFACESHAILARAVAKALGFELELLPIVELTAADESS
jgi:hypothetical protein